MRHSIAWLALTLSLLLGCNTDEPARDLGAKDRLGKPEAARPDRASCPLASCTVTSGRSTNSVITSLPASLRAMVPSGASTYDSTVNPALDA